MKDYKNCEELYEYSKRVSSLYEDLLKRLKPNRFREDTSTGPEPDGKTPFLDTFLKTRGEVYSARLAKAIVESWLVTEPLIFEGEFILGHPRPGRPVSEHFSYGIRDELWVLDLDAYKDRKDELEKLYDSVHGEMNPLTMDHCYNEAKRRFETPETEGNYDNYVGCGLWWVGGFQGHTVPNYRKLVRVGIGGLLSEIEENLPKMEGRKKETLEACKIVLLGMSRWILMYAAAAEEKAEKTEDEDLRALYLGAAENCRRVALDAPKDYYGACQLVWFYCLWDACDCLGRFDSYMKSFYEDLAKKDRQWAEDITAGFMLKILEHGIHNVTLGGTSGGADVTGELSYLMLQLLRKTHETHPRITIRINEKTDKGLLALAVKMWSEGMSDPTVVSDTLVIPSFIKNYGVLPEDAEDYSVLGCQELEIPGKSNFGCEDGVLNLAKILEFTINDGKSLYGGERGGLATGKLSEFKDFESFFEAYEKQVAFFTKHFVELCNLGQEIRAANYAKLVKTPLTDCCIERGLSLDEGGALYNLGCVETAGSSVVADSMTAIKKVVFEEGLVSPQTLYDAICANYEGYEDVRRLLLDAPKFGNDDAQADEMAHRVLESFWKEIKKCRSVRGGEFSGACSLLSGGITFGYHTFATPDGRLKGAPLGNSIGPRPGADTQGLTSMLSSVSKLPLEYGLGGTTCNVNIPTSIMKSGADRSKIQSLITVFMENGGMMAQITTASKDELIKAKEKPEEYQDLIIRIGGFSIKFCELGNAEQDEIISRFA